MDRITLLVVVVGYKGKMNREVFRLLRGITTTTTANNAIIIPTMPPVVALETAIVYNAIVVQRADGRCWVN